MAAQTVQGIPLSKVSPCFLHANSTSHTGPFSAIAELIDNAYDPDVSAKQLWIDKTVIKGQDCLIFMDNGKGMDYDKMHKMLSFGFSDKQSVRGRPAVGLYGNGFKSGSMRLGKDVIVFSKKADTMCVGLLSQTYLKKKEAENVIVPIVMFKNAEQIGSVAQEYEECLHDILAHSMFETKEDLLIEFSAINGTYGTSSTGTRIIIWNLRKTSSGLFELDFTKDRYDIQLPVESTQEPNKKPEIGISAPDCEYSLRAYSSILYLKPRMQIIIQRQKVKTQLVSKSLAHTCKDTYRPNFLQKEIKIRFGYNTNSKDNYGLMLYHNNRLIKAYEHVACQRKANKTGVGVVGVLECNYLTPMHNKQDFEKTEEYRKTLQNVSSKLEEYWKEIRHRRQTNQNCSVPVKRPDQNWVGCNECNKWRKLPDGINKAQLPDEWFCYMNPDPQFRSCTVPEEAEDSDDEQPRYQKTYKQDEKNLKLLKENDRQQSPAQGIPVPSPNSHPHKNAGSRSAHIPTASPISVRKRALGSSRENGESKRASISHPFDSSTPENPSTSTASPKSHNTQASHSSLPNIINPDVDQASSKDNETEATTDDDDILIIEHISSTRPKSTTGTFDITKVKLQCMVSEEELARQMEHGESDTVVSMLDPLLSFRDVCIGTQTQQNPAVKQEEEDSKGRKKEKGGKDGESDHFESEKDFSSVEMNSSTHLNEETRPQQKSVPSIEEKNIGRNNTESSKSEEELSHRETSNEITGDGQTSAKLENSVLNLLEAQQQQDQLLQFLEVASKERDESHDQLLLLSSDVEKLKSQLLELTQSMPKKEHSDHNKQTSPEEAQDYQVLYLQGKEEIKQLQEELRQLKMKKEERERKGQQALLEVDDELACQIDLLLRQIDQGNKEREELMNKVDSLESSKSALVTACESLKKELEKMKRESEKIKPCAEDRGVQTDFPICSHEQSAATSAEASTSGRGTDFGPQHETHQILRDLRQKVARLLVTFVPDLDHQQVNYDCNVIDEILTDVVNDISPAKTAST